MIINNDINIIFNKDNKELIIKNLEIFYIINK
jgi:hypothetical protein